MVSQAQSTLEQFTYDSVGFRGIQIGVGAMWSNKVETTAQYGLQVHLGEIAPKVRLMLGMSYFKADLTNEEISRLEAGILQLVDDPSGNATVDLGRVEWQDIAFAGDVQYLILGAGPRRWQPYVGAGFSFHFRNGSGDRISGTVVEENLDQLQIGLDLTAGTDVLLTRSLVLNLGVRGVLTGNLNTLTLGVGLGYRVP
jgi:outer membrane protein W